MADAKTFVANAPAWIDLSTKDPAGARDYYSKLFGWKIDEPRPDAGGYMLAKQGGKDVAGVGPTQDPNAPSAWNVYIGSRDAEATAKKVEAAGGKVVAPAFDVLDQGRMAVFQDPSGAFISVWQPEKMFGAEVMGKEGSYGWAELNSRGFDRASDFYKKVFGWGTKVSPMGEGQPDYTEFLVDGQSIAGGMEMNPMVPAEVPSYWMVYFTVADVDKSHKKAVDLGGREMLPPQEFPGGRFSILSDAQGAMFGLLKMRQG
ncbi:MAG TPA: VOC family protein [Candidatus Dormibacteraeota bacterium]|nr:VOC family protein [Candidatus Dormibacteraeota bacterium]